MKESKEEKEREDIFDECVFYFSQIDEDEREELREKIEENGGILATVFNKRVTHVIATEELSQKQLQEVESQSAKVIELEVLKDSIKKGKKLDDKKKNDKTPKRKSKEICKSEDNSSDEEKLAWKWNWQSDHGWLTYDAKLIAKLEKAYENGDDEVKVDDERYIDLKAMLQRRYDDNTKRRPVKREKTQLVAKKQKKTESSDSEPEVKGGKIKIIKKGRSAVDPHSGMVKSSHVLEEGNDIWDCMLNQTDIGNNNNKFYVIQLIEDDNAKKWTVWNRWGRVGLAGQHKANVYNSKQAAKDAFKKKFTEKTGNNWDNRHNFVKKRRKISNGRN